MSQLIEIAAFMQHLRDEGLVIVRAEELGLIGAAKTADFRRRMMRKRAISFAEALEMKIFPPATRQGLQEWVERNLTKEEWYTEAKGNRRRMIMTSAISRLKLYE